MCAMNGKRDENKTVEGELHFADSASDLNGKILLIDFEAGPSATQELVSSAAKCGASAVLVVNQTDQLEALRWEGSSDTIGPVVVSVRHCDKASLVNGQKYKLQVGWLLCADRDKVTFDYVKCNDN